ncbi:MAG: monovalent cation/H+ antiporter complex subunit F [Anaerovoracaceae bacterium]
MELLFKILLFGTILTMAMMLVRVFRGPSVYDRLNGIFVIGVNVILVILLTGFITERVDMYVDIALSYGVLGFLSTVIIAMFLGGSKKDDD